MKFQCKRLAQKFLVLCEEINKSAADSNLLFFFPSLTLIAHQPTESSKC